jgi:hypothetical protein
MKTLYAGLVLGALLGLVGCGEQKSPPGGPGAGKTGTTVTPKPGTTTTPPGKTGTATTPGTTDTTASTSGKTPEDSFRITVPSGDTDVTQGHSKDVTVGIDRGKNFDQDVKLECSGAPKGVKIDPTSGVLKAGDTKVKLTIEADKEAALGEHTITVTATPVKSGAKTTAAFKINVKKAS